jgi:hypothetical protein
MGTGSLPFIWPYQHLTLQSGEEIYCMDGGTVYNINVVSAVERCREIVDSDSDIILDVVSPWVRDMPDDKDEHTTIPFWMRFNSLRKYYKSVRDTWHFLHAYPDVTWRHYITPSGKVPPQPVMLDFNNATTWPL